MRQPSVLAIIPAYNEEANIANVIKDLRSSDIGLDIVVINDGSSDQTSAIAKSTGCHVIDLPYNMGIGGAVQTGLIYARDGGYAAAIQFDGDGQHKAEEIPTILNPVLSEETDVSIGSRFLGKKSFASSGVRRIGIVIFRACIYLLTRQHITDNTSGFRAFNQEAVKFLAEHYPCDYPEVEVVVSLTKNDFRIREYPVRMDERQGGQSSITPLKSAYYMVKVILALVVSFLRPPERPTH